MRSAGFTDLSPVSRNRSRHWVLTPLSVVVLVIGIVVSVRGHRPSRKAASARLH